MPALNFLVLVFKAVKPVFEPLPVCIDAQRYSSCKKAHGDQQMHTHVSHYNITIVTAELNVFSVMGHDLLAINRLKLVAVLLMESFSA